jgi:sugar/nucleoside kinase (ribokinase family)
LRRLFVIGDLNVDYVVDGQSLTDGQLAPRGQPIPGGNAFNAARAFARAGFECVVIGSVGADPHGDFLRDALLREGLENVVAVDSAHATGVCHIVYERADRYENQIRILKQHHANRYDSAFIGAAMAAKNAAPGDIAFTTAVVLARQGLTSARNLTATIQRHGAKMILDVVPHDLYRRATAADLSNAFASPVLMIAELETLTRLAGWNRHIELPDDDDWRKLLSVFGAEILALRYGFGHIGKEAVRRRASSSGGAVVLKPDADTGYAALAEPLEKRGFGDRLTAKLLRDVARLL